MDGRLAETAPAFVGRGHELDVLAGALARAGAGQGSAFLVTGEAGIGKTRLAGELRAAAGDRVQVAWGACPEEAGAPAYLPWMQILEVCARVLGPDPLAAAAAEELPRLARLIPSLAARIAPPPPVGAPAFEDERFRLFDAVLRILRTAAAARPLLIVLDDVHAADTPSLLLLRFVAADVTTAPIVLVATQRDLPTVPDGRRAALLAEIALPAHHLRLGGLGEGDVREYLRRTFAIEPTAALVRALRATTEGNPFFVDEVARLLAAEGRLGEDRLTILRVPETVRGLVRARLAGVDDRCRRLLDVAAVAGGRFGIALLEAASGLARTPLLDALATACARGLVRAVPDTLGCYAFSHGIVRDTIYADLAEPERVRLHGRVADGLERLHAADLDPQLAEIAHHAARAALGGDVDRAVDYAIRAGRRAATLLAHEVAVAHFEEGLQALALAAPVDDRRRGELLVLLAESALRSGDVDRARAAALEAGALARRLGWTAGEARAALAIGGPWVEIGTVDAPVVRALEAALEVVGDADGVPRALLMARLARELYWADDPARAAHLADAALAMAARLGDAGARAAALTARAYALWRPDALDERLVVDEEIVHLARAVGDRELELRGRLWLASDLLERADDARFDDEMARYERLATEVRQPSYRWYVPRSHAMRALLHGDLDRAERLGAEAYAIGAGVHPGLAAQARAVLAVALRWERGDLAGLVDALGEFHERYPDVAAWTCGQAFLHAEQDDAEAARRAIARIGHIRRDANWLLALALLSLAVAHLNDVQRAAALFELLLPYRRRVVTMGRALICFGTTSHVLGVLAIVLEHWAEAEEHLEDALALHERLGARPWAARTRARLGHMLLARGRTADRARARTLLQDALAVAEELGMTGLATALGARRRTATGGDAAPPRVASAGIFRCDGDYWTVGLDGRVARAKDSKGMRCLAHLLRHPGHDFHAMELDAAATSAGGVAGLAGAATPPEGLQVARAADAGPLLDAHARRAYTARLRDLRAELEDASERNDTGRTSRLRAEIDALADELGRAVGLGGRPRAAASPQERARVNVTKQVKAAIRHLGTASPAVADALARSIRTGRLCSYVPDPRAPIDWDL